MKHPIESEFEKLNVTNEESDFLILLKSEISYGSYYNRISKFVGRNETKINRLKTILLWLEMNLRFVNHQLQNSWFWEHESDAFVSYKFNYYTFYGINFGIALEVLNKLKPIKWGHWHTVLLEEVQGLNRNKFRSDFLSEPSGNKKYQAYLKIGKRKPTDEEIEIVLQRVDPNHVEKARAILRNL